MHRRGVPHRRKTVAEDKNGRKPFRLTDNIRAQLNAIGGLTRAGYSAARGVDPVEARKADQDVEVIRDVAGRISKDYKWATGPNIVEFFNRMSEEDARKSRKDNRRLIPISTIIEKAEQGIVSNMMLMEQDRVARYDTMEAIHNHIPQIATAIDTYVDNIMSPDDFTKQVLNLHYEGVGDDEERSGIMERLKELNEQYLIDDKAHVILTDTLKLGDQFVATLRTDKELKKLMLLKESPLAVHASPPTYGQLLTEAVVSECLSESDISAAFEFALMAPGAPKAGTREATKLKEGFSAGLAGAINEVASNNIDFGTSDSISSNSAARRTEYRRMQSDANTRNPGDPDPDAEGNKGWKNVGGSIVKILDPRRVIKLSVDDICYGYYYIEKTANNDFGRQPRNGYTDMLSGAYSQMAGTNSSEMATKADVVANMFAKVIGKRLDNKFVADNPEFRAVVYNLLHQGFLTSQKIRITFFTPQEVHHFKGPGGSGEYGQSMYQKILFTAKIYMAVLTSTLMNKLVRGPDKRVFYVEVGLDNDIEATIQSFIRDIKSRDLRLDDLGNLTTIFNSVGQFHDLYVPVINGEKPVEVETITGSDAQLDSDFLEYLRKTMISGLGVPSSLLQYGEEVEFAKTLTMQNQKFARAITVHQKLFGTGFSNIFRRLYMNEHHYADADGRDTVLSPAEIRKGLRKRKRLDGSVSEDAFDDALAGGSPPAADESPEDDEVWSSIDDTDPVWTQSLDGDGEKRLRKAKKPGHVLDPQETGFDPAKIFVRFPIPASLMLTNMLEQVNNAKDVIGFIVDTLIGQDVGPEKKRRATVAVSKEVVKTVDWERYEKLVKKAVAEENVDAIITAPPGGDAAPPSGGGGF
jgi:hypothetical protein